MTTLPDTMRVATVDGGQIDASIIDDSSEEITEDNAAFKRRAVELMLQQSPLLIGKAHEKMQQGHKLESLVAVVAIHNEKVAGGFLETHEELLRITPPEHAYYGPVQRALAAPISYPFLRTILVEDFEGGTRFGLLGLSVCGSQEGGDT